MQIMNEILNGSGQGLRRFELVNGERHWLEMPSNEWQKQASIDQKHNNKNKNDIQESRSLYKSRS